ncbi:MAG: methionyl-tRNA formyltransferase [Syntrophales bacterium]
MRIIYLANNRTGLEVLKYLRGRREKIAGLVVHPVQKQKFGKEIIEASGLPPEAIFDGSRLNEQVVLEKIRALRPDIGISVFFGYMLRQGFLSLLPEGCINLHPAFLPFNRGAYPNVWSIVDGTPAGVTLHYVDAGVDTGDIIARKEVEAEPIDTGESLYLKLERESLNLFRRSWPAVKSGRAERIPQSRTEGTIHRVSDVDGLDEIDLNRSYTAGELINILRARSFPPYKGAWFRQGNRRIYMRLELFYEE